jgi:hypothetical protein
MLLAEFITSAVYDSSIGGQLAIPDPCHIDALAFTGMKVTSTANIVGGDVALPAGGVPLAYWDLNLVPTGDPHKSGVLSVRTGRVLFTAAGVAEPIHFARPFGLTWGEMLADGNLGELYLDYNNYGQRFDGTPYSPSYMALSSYLAGATNAHLATCGTVHLAFFGPHFVNIQDARDGRSGEPYGGRCVTVPRSALGPSCKTTDLYLNGTWRTAPGDPLVTFDFPDATTRYNDAAQKGFIGQGKADARFFHSGGLDAELEVHGTTIDIRLSSTVTHDLDLGLMARLSGMSGICGCVRIDGPMLSRIAFYGYLEACAAIGSGILEPKAARMVEVSLSATPNSLTYDVAGDLLLQMVGEAVDVSGSAHLRLDWSRGFAEGDVEGHIDCSGIIGGLEADGQISWHVGSDMQYLQGRMKVFVCGWIDGGGIEGGFFIGHDVPKGLAWVLDPGSRYFGVSDAILPATLTGLFGYGQVSWELSLYVVSGGMELYAGMGAFSLGPPGLSGVWSAIAGLPYVIGSCGIHVHGEILGGLVSASAWADLSLRGPIPVYFEGQVGLEGCVLWVFCGSVDCTAGLNADGPYLY